MIHDFDLFRVSSLLVSALVAFVSAKTFFNVQKKDEESGKARQETFNAVTIKRIEVLESDVKKHSEVLEELKKQNLEIVRLSVKIDNLTSEIKKNL